MFRDGRTPVADICEWGNGPDHLLILSERANSALAPFLRETCEVVPVHCATAAIFGYGLKSVEDVLDVDKSEGDWRTYGGQKSCMNFSKYSIHTEKLGRAPMFRTPQNAYGMLVLQPVVDAVQQHALTGFRYIRVWPHVSIRPVVKVEVKKLPRAVEEKSRDPKLSTSATEIAAGFVEELLGSPLTADSEKPFKLVAYRLPDLFLPTGAIVAADLLFSEEKSFARRVTPGAYPLTLVAANVGNDERIAFAILQFSEGPVATWEIAMVCEPGAAKARKSHKHSYGVDSGTGGLCDAGAQEVMLDLADPEGSFQELIENEMKKSYQHTRSWVHVQTVAGSAAIFSSGFGDGSYSSYLGLDCGGEPVALVTDFGVLDWPRMPE